MRHGSCSWTTVVMQGEFILLSHTRLLATPPDFGSIERSRLFTVIPTAKTRRCPCEPPAHAHARSHPSNDWTCRRSCCYTLRTPSCIHIVVGKRHQSQMNFKITSWKTVPAVAPCLEEIVIRPKLNGRALRLLIPFSWAARFCGLREEHSCYSQRVS